MIKTNQLTKSKTITFTSGVLEYRNLSFQYFQDTDETWKFIDWLNGDVKPPVVIGDFIINEEEYDTVFLNRSFTSSLLDYTKEKLLQRLNIHLNELKYRYENTENIGIPYLEKPTADELDLFIKEAILSTIGVKEIVSFISRKTVEASKQGNKLGYFADFSIKIQTGETIWQSIAI